MEINLNGGEEAGEAASIVLLTNMENSYQRAFAEAMFRLIGNGFRLICYEPIDKERVALGWKAGANAPWLLHAWRSGEEMAEASRLIASATAVVRGAAPLEAVASRIRAGALTLTYAERPLKPSRYAQIPMMYASMIRRMWPLDLPNHHLLAAGAYCAGDFRMFRLFQGRSWKWGYFPEVSESMPVRSTSGRVKLLWAGRMLAWKRVDLLLESAARLLRTGHDFDVDLIGDGEERSRLQGICRAEPLLQRVRILPPRTPEEVRAAMSAADIYVFPSNKEEGWGAVENEAMASGCCLVASDAAGASPWLIEHGRNGYLFRSGSASSLTEVLAAAISAGAPERNAVGRRAWETVSGRWSPRVAAERLVALVGGLMGTTEQPAFMAGPCSPCD